MRVAAVDIGTNTVRLLVADVDGGDVTEITRGREITRLGQDVDRDKRLHPDAVARTVDAIERAVTASRTAGAERIRVVGTSALRDAVDRDDFARAVADRTGQSLEVIGGDEEGKLSMLGATSGLPDGDYTVCDIGGGSTELSTTDGSVSLDIGSVRVRERCLHHDPPTSAEVADARRVIDAALTGVDIGGSATPMDSGGALVGVAGTVTTVAALVLGLEVYNPDAVHHSRLTLADVASCSERLLRMTADGIAATTVCEPGRADVIGSGSLILRCVMEYFGFDVVLVSERDILDGLVLDLVR